jgi:hypothetical protein
VRELDERLRELHIEGLVAVRMLKEHVPSERKKRSSTQRKALKRAHEACGSERESE